MSTGIYFFVFLRVSHPVTSLASSTNETFVPEDSRFLFSEVLILKWSYIHWHGVNEHI